MGVKWWDGHQGSDNAVFTRAICQTLWLQQTRSRPTRHNPDEQSAREVMWLTLMVCYTYERTPCRPVMSCTQLGCILTINTALNCAVSQYWLSGIMGRLSKVSFLSVWSAPNETWLATVLMVSHHNFAFNCSHIQNVAGTVFWANFDHDDDVGSDDGDCFDDSVIWPATCMWWWTAICWL